jgi:hypothetical protein
MTDASPPRDYEKSDADPRLIAVLAAGVALFLTATPFLLLAVYPDAEKQGDISGDLRRPPEPRLQIRPQADLEQVRANETAQLNGTGWIDRDRQVAHIPIDRAIDLLAQRGLPGWPSPKPASDASMQRR